MYHFLLEFKAKFCVLNATYFISFAHNFQIDTPYLMFRIDRLCVDAAKTVYGYSVQANLSGIQLVDKINVGKF